MKRVLTVAASVCWVLCFCLIAMSQAVVQDRCENNRKQIAEYEAAVNDLEIIIDSDRFENIRSQLSLINKAISNGRTLTNYENYDGRRQEAETLEMPRESASETDPLVFQRAVRDRLYFLIERYKSLGAAGIQSKITGLKQQISIHQNRLKDLKCGELNEEGYTSSGGTERNTGAGLCSVSGIWTHSTSTVGGSTWVVEADGTATEQGLGGATGTARLSGKAMRIIWSTPNGWSGVYEWNLDDRCSGGRGKITFEAGGRAGESAISTVTHSPSPNDKSNEDSRITVTRTVSCETSGARQPDNDTVLQIGDTSIQFDSGGQGSAKLMPGTYKVRLTGQYRVGSLEITDTTDAGFSLAISTRRISERSDVSEGMVTLQPGRTYRMTAKMLSCSPAAGGITDVGIASLTPGVEFRRGPTGEWQTLRVGTVLVQGDEISTDPDGSVVLRFADGSTTEIRYSTQIKISAYFTEGGVTRAELLLRNGEILSKIKRSETIRSDFTIKSPSAAVSVRGTEFTTSYDKNTGETRVKVIQGAVAVTPDNPSLSPVSLTANQSASVSPTKTRTFTSAGGQPAAPVDLLRSITGNWKIVETGGMAEITPDGRLIYQGSDSGLETTPYKRGDIVASNMKVVNETLIGAKFFVKPGSDCPVMAPLPGSLGVSPDRNSISILVTLYSYVAAPTCQWTTTSTGSVSITLQRIQ